MKMRITKKEILLVDCRQKNYDCPLRSINVAWWHVWDLSACYLLVRCRTTDLVICVKNALIGKEDRLDEFDSMTSVIPMR